MHYSYRAVIRQPADVDHRDDAHGVARLKRVAVHAFHDHVLVVFHLIGGRN